MVSFLSSAVIFFLHSSGLVAFLGPQLFGLGAPAGGVGLALVAQVLHALGASRSVECAPLCATIVSKIFSYSTTESA